MLVWLRVFCTCVRVIMLIWLNLRLYREQKQIRGVREPKEAGKPREAGEPRELGEPMESGEPREA